MGYIRPITPVKVFSFTDIPAALRYMGSGSHIGKIVISDCCNREVNVPVSTELLPEKIRYAKVSRFDRHHERSAFVPM